MHEILLKINSATDTLIVICRKFFERIFLNFKWKQLIPSKQSSWWRRLEDVFCLCLQKTSSRGLDQDEYIRLTHTSSDEYIRLNHTSSRRLAKKSSRHLQDVLEDEKLLRWRRAEDVFKTCLQDVFKTSWRPTNLCWAITEAAIGGVL